MDRKALKLYLVTDRTLAGSKDICDIVTKAVKGGVTMVQLREKDIDTKEFISLAKRLKEALEPFGVPLVINDRVDVALASGADGVHIGQSDMPYALARKLLGPDRIIGLSVENQEQVAEANRTDVDYIGISPVFATPTKTDTAPPFGLEGLSKAVAASVHPTVAIGGINRGNAREIFRRGADGIAVVSAIVAAEDPESAARELAAACSVGKGEFDLIRGIRSDFPAPEGFLGIGDDCAVLPQRDGFDTLVSTDMLVEGCHFLTGEMTPYQIGWKAAASNFSDIAAMGGTPQGAFLAFALPERFRGEWTDEFLRGFSDISRKYGFPLLGGDTTSSIDRICICITVLGKAPSGQAKLRSGARPGDLVCVTGTLGDSAGGLAVILGKMPRTEDELHLLGRHFLPEPRLEEGKKLAANPAVHAMMDISDGIGSDLRHIIEESGTGAEVFLKDIPHSPQLERFCSRNGLDIFDFSIDGGEDYELLFTIDAAAEPQLDVPHSVIGKITSSGRIEWTGGAKEYKGFRHF